MRWPSGGLQGGGPPLVVYVSAHSHSSVEKAALLAGFGREHVRAVEVDATHYAMRPDALRAAIQADLAKGLKPCAIVGTSGTTTSTAFDPLAALAELAKQYGTWLHVDAAMAGSAMILPECRPLWDGVEGADSLVFNPHKWLGAAFDCSLYYVRDPEHLMRVMSTNPSYLQSAVDSRVKNLRDWGIPLGRRFRALKLWCLIREQGVETLAAAAAARSRQRALARAAGEGAAAVARAGAGRVADAVRSARAARSRRRSARSSHPGVGRARQPLGRGLPDAGDAGRPLDGARLDRLTADRAHARRGPVGCDARRGRVGVST